jgi:hypothetical protein
MAPGPGSFMPSVAESSDALSMPVRDAPAELGRRRGDLVHVHRVEVAREPGEEHDVGLRDRLRGLRRLAYRQLLKSHAGPRQAFDVIRPVTPPRAPAAARRSTRRRVLAVARLLQRRGEPLELLASM